MPTEAAYLSELALVDAIALHSYQKISDAALKDVLDKYIANHIFVFYGFARELKTGDWDNWAKVGLVTCDWRDANAPPCNFIQANLYYLLEKEAKTDIEFSYSKI